MYTDEDLNSAIKSGIFSQDEVERFRSQMASLQHTMAVDEENFRLISGFNDVFVLIASGLLLVSIGWLGAKFSPFAGSVLFALVSWGLAEFFVLKRRMALPAIGLLLTFLAGVVAAPITFVEHPNEWAIAASGVLAVIGARLHWMRFRVPITIAAGTAALLASIVGVIVAYYPMARFQLLNMMLAGGVITFALAMYWDMRDTTRTTRQTDVAFWLHLLSAPLIVHPIFASLGILHGVADVSSAVIVVALYILLAVVSIIVDRRAIMVSALVYVIYAFATLLKTYGLVSYSFGITGLVIGASLLLLSAYWPNSRSAMLKLIPHSIQTHLPAARA